MKKCKTCYGYGLHYLGEHTPVGPIDASDGYPTLPCPECGANANPKKSTNTNVLEENETLFINADGKKLNPMAKSFMEFCESLGLQFVDVTPMYKKVTPKRVKSLKTNDSTKCRKTTL